MESSPAATLQAHTDDDLSALAWVQDELRRSLEAAHKALRRCVRETQASSGSDVDAADPAVLRNARQQIHQGVGALELIGLPMAASVLRASESALQRYVARPQRLEMAGVERIERASFAVLDFVARLLAGRPVSSLSLFPQYREVQELAGADRIHPADLWPFDWRWRELPAEAAVAPRQADAATRAQFEQQLLALMRNPDPAAAARMSELCAGLAAGAERHAATLWQLAAAFFEGQAQGLLKVDVHSKRVASRLLAQLRSLQSGEPAVSERLARDLVFFCAQCGPAPRPAPRLEAVRRLWELDRQQPVDYESSRLGRFDPALLQQARKRVAGAKEAWSAVAGGEMQRLASLAEQLALVGDTLQRLYPGGQVLADEFAATVEQLQRSGQAPAAALAMEVATGLLYLDASFEDGDFDDADSASRLHRLVERIAAVRAGAPPDPLEPWMEELYRRVSDRQTMGSVMHELRSALSEAEKLIDQFFRQPSERDVLIPVPGQLSAMRGVLSVLGLDHAAQALHRMRDEIDGLITASLDEEHPDAVAARFERLAGNLGALGFLIDMLSVQPHMAKSLFVFDADAGTLAPVMGRAVHQAGAEAAAAARSTQPRLIERVQQLALDAVREDVPAADVALDLERLSTQAQLADHPGLVSAVAQARAALDRAGADATPAEARTQLSDALNDFASGQADASSVEPPAPVVPLPKSDVVAPASAADDEMLEVFLEEAREVIGDARQAHAQLQGAPGDVTLLTTLRRGFHTLKGSSRMVGLASYGEAAWACERIYNERLGEQQPADARLLAFTATALEHLGAWVDGIAAGQEGTEHAEAVLQAAHGYAQAATAAPEAPVEAIAEPPAEPIIVELPAEPIIAELPVEPIAELPVEPIIAEFEPLQAVEPAGVTTVPLPGPLPDLELSFSLDFPLPIEPAADAPDEPSPVAEPVAKVPSPTEFGIDLDLDLDLSSLEADAVASMPAELAPLDSGALARLDPFEPPLQVSPPPTDAEEAAPAERLPEPLVFSAEDVLEETPVAPAATPVQPMETVAADGVDDEQVKHVGPLRIAIPLFNIYLNEADELSRQLSTEIAEWALELHRPVGEQAISLAHSLAGSSATVGFSDLSNLARSFEHALMRSQAIGLGTQDEAVLFTDVAEEIRRLLHQFAAGFLKSPPVPLLQRLAAHQVNSARRYEELEKRAVAPDIDLDAPQLGMPSGSTEEPARPAGAAEPHAAAAPDTPALQRSPLKALQPLPAAARSPVIPADAGTDGFDDIDAVDAIDAELFPIFRDEALELLPQLAASLRDWAGDPAQTGHAAACMRSLHTLKGGARLAGAMRLGEMAHRLETRIEQLLAHPPIEAAAVETLQAGADSLLQAFEALTAPASPPAANVDSGAPAPDAVAPRSAETAARPVPEAGIHALAQDRSGQPEARAAGAAPQGNDLPEIDWSRFAQAPATAAAAADQGSAAGQGTVRVRTPLLDRMVNQAGEVSITRSRIETQVRRIHESLNDLTDNLERLRQQLRDIELQGETQMSSRLEAAKAAAQAFDPLEFDRYTRFQELTRMMAESVNDVATVQRTLQRALESAEDELAAQARLTRDLQDDLLRTRMVEFEGLSDRLYRVVRQAAKETGKQVRLDIAGGSIEVDRGVLDRMTPAFEHLLRNAVTHGIEPAAVREAAGKDPAGSIVVAVTHEGNEVGVEFRDDGGGLDLARIRDKGVALGLLDAQRSYDDADLADLIFTPGFSTAASVTELAGRGVGMDVVRSDVNAMGGRIETATEAGRGTSFRLVLPLTTAVTQVVMLRSGESTVAVPSTLVEIVRRVDAEEVDRAHAAGSFDADGQRLPFFWLGALLQHSPRSTEAGGRTRPVVVIRSAQQRIALHVDEVLGNQEVVVKHLGPQLSRLPGLAGMTLLPSGTVALIYNPVALAALYGESARQSTQVALRAPLPQQPVPTQAQEAAAAPLILVVDDSLTVRRVTQRLLSREGYRVVLAKDGLEALERLAEERPHVLLSDIEMPRMDGFDLVRNVRGDARLSGLPVIMITSRIAQKHRDYAAELGVDHYLGKPYSEEDLLALISRYTSVAAAS